MATITDNLVERTALGDRDELIIRDGKLTGFCLRIRRKAGDKLARTFFVMYEIPGEDGKRKRKKVAIGDYPTFKADDARAQAQSMLQAHANGDDPAAQRKAKREAPTFEKLVEEFETEHLADKKPRTVADYKERIARRLIPEFKQMKVADITGWHVREFIRKGKDRPTDTNRSVAVLSSMMAFAMETNPPMRVDNPCIGLKRHKEKKRDAWVDKHDLPAFLNAVHETGGTYQDILLFLTVAGWRISETRLLTWDMVDLKRMVAHLPDDTSKTGAQDRELSSDAASIIARQAHRVGFVFSKGGTRPLSYHHLRAALWAVCDKAGIERISPHALRHTAASWSAINGATAHELRDAFGWKTLAMTQRYVERSEELARRGVERAASAMNVLKRPSADIIELKVASSK